MMRPKWRQCAAFVLLGSIIVLHGAAASAAGNAEAGWQLARQWCSGCHVVDSTGRGTDVAPPFGTIAQQRGNRQWVRAWLQSPHPAMPNLHLSRGEIDDIVAYLDSLAAPKR